MKKLMILAALTMAAPAAMASKARVEALGNSRQLVDFQTAFDRPYQFMALSTQATFEWGQDNSVATFVPADQTVTYGSRHAEGGFLMRSDDHAFGAYVGRRSDAFNGALTAMYAIGTSGGGAFNSGLLGEQNPLNLFYATKTGDWTWGVTAKYSSGKEDNVAVLGDRKSSSAGLAIGASNGTFEVELVQGLGAKSETDVATVEAKAMTQIGLGYKLSETMEVYGQYQTVKADGNVGAFDGTALELNRHEIGFVNTAMKTEDASFFYGVAYRGSKKEIADGASTTETTTLPVWLGVEANAASWLVLRGSIVQNVLLNEEKTGSDKADLDSIAFNAGVGIKLGNGMLDANFGTAQTGSLGFGDGTPGNEFLSNVAYTHTF